MTKRSIPISTLPRDDQGEHRRECCPREAPTEPTVPAEVAGADRPPARARECSPELPAPVRPARDEPEVPVRTTAERLSDPEHAEGVRHAEDQVSVHPHDTTELGEREVEARDVLEHARRIDALKGFVFIWELFHGAEVQMLFERRPCAREGQGTRRPPRCEDRADGAVAP